jgi:hypothetical protein
LDFSVFKNNYVKRISENFNAEFRAEFFHILNHANFASPTDNFTVFDQNGQHIQGAGLITSTQTTSRQIQFALNIDIDMVGPTQATCWPAVRPTRMGKKFEYQGRRSRK